MNLLQKYFILTLYITLHTDYNSFYKWTKILILDVTIFGLKMKVKTEKLCRKRYFEIPRAPSELLLPSAVQKSLPRKAELAWQVSRYLWRGTWNFKIFFLDHFSPSFQPRMAISRVKDLFHLWTMFYFYVCCWK